MRVVRILLAAGCRIPYAPMLARRSEASPTALDSARTTAENLRRERYRIDTDGDSQLICIGRTMRTTLNIADDLLQRARDLSGVQEKTAQPRG